MSRAQLRRGGITDASVADLVSRGDLVQVHDGVYRTVDTVLSPRRGLLAACLAIGGVVAASHRAALWLWDLSDPLPCVEVSTPAAVPSPPDDVAVHVRDDLDIAAVTVHRGVPVTTPRRTLRDVYDLIDADLHEVAVAKARYLGLI